jgi:hypothetical protein
MPFAENVKLNSIIAVKPALDIETGNDGVVAYQSAHLDGAESEFVVRWRHSCQGHPLVIEEVRRILLEHLRASLNESGIGFRFGGELVQDEIAELKEKASRLRRRLRDRRNQKNYNRNGGRRKRAPMNQRVASVLRSLSCFAARNDFGLSAERPERRPPWRSRAKAATEGSVPWLRLRRCMTGATNHAGPFAAARTSKQPETQHHKERQV